MKVTKVRMLFASIAALALMVGVGSAIAATGGDGKSLKGVAAKITGKATFEAAVVKELGTTAAKLDAAVKAAAKANIAAALAADEITAAAAETLNDALADGTVRAMRLATAEGVAEELGTTVAKLDAAFSKVGKAQATARVDQKLKDGDITEAQATEMKTRIAEATFGFGEGGHGGHGGRGHHGHGGPRGDDDAPADSSSSGATPAALAAA
jgi:hypothetical protein